MVSMVCAIMTITSSSLASIVLIETNDQYSYYSLSCHFIKSQSKTGESLVSDYLIRQSLNEWNNFLLSLQRLYIKRTHTWVSSFIHCTWKPYACFISHETSSALPRCLQLLLIPIVTHHFAKKDCLTPASNIFHHSSYSGWLLNINYGFSLYFTV